MASHARSQCQNGWVSEELAGRYELVAVVGRGSMGEVWKARDRVLQRDVAVKVVSGAKQQDAVALKRFQREAIAMANLFHPNVVSVYDVGSDSGRSFMVMELLTGPSVARSLADNGPMRLDKAVRMGAEVARGLSAAHAIGVTHRDIKPGNVLEHHKVTKIVDFGIARLEAANQATLTSPAMAIGTAAYMSPEQARGKAVQPPSDVYSLACLMFAMLTGKPPFVNADPIEVARAHAMDQPPLVTAARPEVPQDLADLLARMLVKRPDERPTAPQVAMELSRIESSLLGLEDPMSPYSPLAPAAEPTVRRPVRVATAPTPTEPARPQPDELVARSQRTPIQPEEVRKRRRWRWRG